MLIMETRDFSLLFGTLTFQIILTMNHQYTMILLFDISNYIDILSFWCSKNDREVSVNSSSINMPGPGDERGIRLQWHINTCT